MRERGERGREKCSDGERERERERERDVSDRKHVLIGHFDHLGHLQQQGAHKQL